MIWSDTERRDGFHRVVAKGVDSQRLYRLSMVISSKWDAWLMDTKLLKLGCGQRIGAENRRMTGKHGKRLLREGSDEGMQHFSVVWQAKVRRYRCSGDVSISCVVTDLAGKTCYGIMNS